MKKFNSDKAVEDFEDVVKHDNILHFSVEGFTYWLTQDIPCPNKICKVTEGGCIVCNGKQTIQRINHPIFWRK